MYNKYIKINRSVSSLHISADHFIIVAILFSYVDSVSEIPNI